ncbi:MAG TPA: hypothetical protein VFT16_03640 [Candidatus Saccharimonadales bacterium]|nr:hypothetical protein [Candidatus Saccharimonadales bacterium]
MGIDSVADNYPESGYDGTDIRPASSFGLHENETNGFLPEGIVPTETPYDSIIDEGGAGYAHPDHQEEGFGGPVDDGSNRAVSDRRGVTDKPTIPEGRMLLDGRRATDTELVRIRATGEPTGPDDKIEYDRPTMGSMVAALRRGEVLRYELSRKEANGPIETLVSPALKPPGAEVEPVDGTEEAHKPQAVGGKEECWVRFEKHDIPSMKKTSTRDTDDLSGKEDDPLSEDLPFQARDLLEGYDGPVKLVVELEGISPKSEEYDQIIREVRNRSHNAGLYEDDEIKASVGVERLFRVAQASGTALARVAVRVCAPVEDLPRVAVLVEGALPSTSRITWSAEREGQNLVGYTTEKAARQAPLSDPEAQLFEAREARNNIAYLDVETEGMQKVHRQNMAVEQELPPDDRAFKGGYRLDNLFDSKGVRRVAGDLLLRAKDLVRNVLIFGGTGVGKSEFARQLVASAKRDNYLRRQAGEDILPLKVFAIDFKKGGASSNWGKVFSDRCRQMGLTEDEARVTYIRPGEGGLRPILDICNPRFSTVDRQIERILHSVLVGVSSGTGVGMKGADGETQRIVERYTKRGIIRSFQKYGWVVGADVQTKFGGRTPPHPTMPEIAHAIRESFHDMDYSDKTSLDLSEFNAGQFDNNLLLVPGRFFKDGHPIDFEAMLDDSGTTTIEMDQLGNNDTARKVAAVGIIQEIEKVVDARHAAMGIKEGGVQELEVLIVLDEAGQIFDMTPAGFTVSEFLTRMRDKGIGFVVSQQIIGDINSTALGNFEGGIFALGSKEIEFILKNSLMGNTDEQQLKYMTSKEAKLNKGTGLAFVPGADSPLRVRSERLSAFRATIQGMVQDARRFVRLGSYNDVYSGETIAEANEFLCETRTGSLITAWAEINVALVLDGRETLKAAGPFRESLKRMKDAKLRAAAIIEAVDSAVDARVASMYTPAGPDALKKFLIGQMLKQARGGEVPPINPRYDLCLDRGYYNRIIDIVENAMTAPPLDNSKDYQDFLSVGANEIVGTGRTQIIKISGDSAQEQKVNAELLMRRSIKAVQSVITASAERTVSPEELQQAKLAVVRLVGSPDNLAGLAALREQLELKHDQVEHLERILADIPVAQPDKQAVEMCLFSMLQDIERKIEERRDTAPAENLAAWKGAYDNNEFIVPSGLAKDQLELIMEHLRDRVKNSKYDEEIIGVDLLFASDRRRGGLALDNAVAGLRPKEGLLYRSASRLLSPDGRPERFTIIDRAKELDVDAWAKLATAGLIYGQNPNFTHTKGEKRWLVKEINGHVHTLGVMAARAKAKQNTQGQTVKR